MIVLCLNFEWWCTLETNVRIRSIPKSLTGTFYHKNALKSFNSIINMNFEQYTTQSIKLTISHVYQFERSSLHAIVVIYSICIPHPILHMALHLVFQMALHPVFRMVLQMALHSNLVCKWKYPHRNGRSPISLILDNF
jgi:hypothetical protein